MNNPDHISGNLETIFWVKILKFFKPDLGLKKFGSGMEKIRIRGKHPGSATLPKKVCVPKRDQFLSSAAIFLSGRSENLQLATAHFLT
jgi:hypothetical protein